jgi:hypothetical protein
VCRAVRIIVPTTALVVALLAVAALIEEGGARGRPSTLDAGVGAVESTGPASLNTLGSYTNPLGEPGYYVQLDWRNVTIPSIDPVNPDYPYDPYLQPHSAPATFSGPILSDDNPYDAAIFVYVNLSYDLVVDYILNGTVQLVHYWVPLFIDSTFFGEFGNQIYDDLLTSSGELEAIWTLGIPSTSFTSTSPIYLEMFNFLNGSYVLYNTGITYDDWSNSSGDEDYFAPITENGWFAYSTNASDGQELQNWSLVNVFTGQRVAESGFVQPYYDTNSLSFVPDYGVMETDYSGASGTEVFNFVQFNSTTLSVVYKNVTISTGYNASPDYSDGNNIPLYYEALPNGSLVYMGFYQLDGGAGKFTEYAGITLYQWGSSVLDINANSTRVFGTSTALDSNQVGLWTYQTQSGLALQGTGAMGQPFYNMLNYTSISGGANASWINSEAIDMGGLFQDRVAVGVVADPSGYLSYFVNESKTTDRAEQVVIYWIPQYTSLYTSSDGGGNPGGGGPGWGTRGPCNPLCCSANTPVCPNSTGGGTLPSLRGWPPSGATLVILVGVVVTIATLVAALRRRIRRRNRPGVPPASQGSSNSVDLENGPPK